MPLLQIKDFAGVVPIKGDRAIDDNYATAAVNTWLYGQELRGVRPPTHLVTLAAATRDVMRVPKRSVGGDPTYPSDIPPPSYLGDSNWLQFNDINTDVVKNALIEDQYERWYFCSPSTGPQFNTYARMLDALPPYKLGVPAPGVAVDSVGYSAWTPIIGTITGGAAPTVTRSYLYTWVNEFGEESAPSLAASKTGNADGIWHISNIVDPPNVSPTYPGWSKKWLYRTVTGSSGGFDYYRVAEIPLGQLVFDDDGASRPDSAITMNLVLESTSWGLPPDNLQGWVMMPNGFLVAYDKAVPLQSDPRVWTGGNNIYMSEQYHFHAWPSTYKYATETLVVGLGVLGQTCVVATQGFPASLTGTKPSTCVFTKSTAEEPCMSRGSIVSTPSGVLYASQNGLIMVGPEGIKNVTESLVTREEWTKNYMPQYLRAARYQNGYLALRMPPTPGVRSGYFLDPTALQVALTEFSDLGDVRNLIGDYWSGEVFVLRTTGDLQRWDPPVDDNGDPNMDLMAVLWRSKEFQFPFQENFGAYAIYWDPARYSDNPYSASVLPVGEQVHLKVYANRQVVYDQEVPLCGRPVRLPSGFKSDLWQFEIRARAPVYSLHVASTVKELKNV